MRWDQGLSPWFIFSTVHGLERPSPGVFQGTGIFNHFLKIRNAGLADLAAALSPQLLGLFKCLPWSGFHVGGGYLCQKRLSRSLTTSWRDPHALFSNTGIFRNFLK